jgi:hypothetical protein
VDRGSRPEEEDTCRTLRIAAFGPSILAPFLDGCFRGTESEELRPGLPASPSCSTLVYLVWLLFLCLGILNIAASVTCGCRAPFFRGGVPRARGGRFPRFMARYTYLPTPSRRWSRYLRLGGYYGVSRSCVARRGLHGWGCGMLLGFPSPKGVSATYEKRCL